MTASTRPDRPRPERIELAALAVGLALCPECGCLMLALGRHADKHQIWHGTINATSGTDYRRPAPPTIEDYFPGITEQQKRSEGFQAMARAWYESSGAAAAPETNI